MAMAEHPDSKFKDYIMEGLHQGFRIGFDYWKHSCVPAYNNLPSVVSHPAVVQEYLEKECRLGRMVGPLPKGSTPGLQISPFGEIDSRPTRQYQWETSSQHLSIAAKELVPIVMAARKTRPQAQLN